MNMKIGLRKERLDDGTVFEVATGLPINPNRSGTRPTTFGVLRQKLMRLKPGEGIEINKKERMSIGQISSQTKPMAEFRTQTFNGVLYATRIS